MGLGIGLGSFMGGISGGYGLGRSIQDDWEKQDNKKALKAVDSEGKAAFDADVAGGKAEPDSWDSYYRDKIMPKKVQELEKQGDIEGAAKYSQWAESKGAMAGTKLFSSGLLKAQSGDIKGALGDFIGAGAAKGYLSHPYKVGDVTEIPGADGQPGGYRVMVTGQDGKAQPIDFASGQDVIRFGATYLNPEAAYKSWEAAGTAASKVRAEVAGDKAKLANRREDDTIRRGSGLGLGGRRGQYGQDDEKPEKLYDNARKELLAEDFEFGNRPAAEQDKLILGRVQQRQDGIKKLRTGPEPTGLGTTPGAAAAPKKIIVDSTTGKPVDMNSLGKPAGQAQPTAKPQSAQPQQQSSGTARDDGLDDEAGLALDEARASVKGGVLPEEVRNKLLYFGVPQNLWPR